MDNSHKTEVCSRGTFYDGPDKTRLLVTRWLISGKHVVPELIVRLETRDVLSP